MNTWFAYDNVQPIYYDYGNNITYQDNSVYVDGQDVGTADEYYEQAQGLADTGAQAQTTDDTQWMPLGVFAMTHDDQTKPTLILQLAVDKNGTIRGNYTDTAVANDTKPVQGSVDKKTQRAAWTIGRQQGQRDRNRNLQPDQRRSSLPWFTLEKTRPNSGFWYG